MDSIMSYEELENLVLEEKPTVLVNALSSYTEKERKTLSAKANKLRIQLSRSKANKDASDKLIKHIKKQGEYIWNSKAHQNSVLAVFALCPISSLKNSDVFVWFDMHSLWVKVISDRKPSWLDDWLDYDLQQEFSAASFNDIEQWIKEGICQKPTADGYFQQFASEMMSIERDDKRPPKEPISERIKNSPHLIENIWKLFEVENQAFNTEGWLTANAPDNYETWPEALVKLSLEGVVDRKRLLHASLDGLNQDLKQNQLSGFHKFHHTLQPSKAELHDFQGEYLSLLCHPIGHVVKFALTMLTKIEKEGGLQNEIFLREAQTVFMQNAKGNATTVLKTIKKIIKANAGLKKQCIAAVMEGIKHEHVDVQDMAITMIESEQACLDADMKHNLLDLASYASASLQSRLNKITGDAVESDSTDAFERDEEYESVSYTTIHSDLSGIEVLPYIDELKPINDLDELIDTLSHAVEIVDNPDEVERIIDGISRLCDHRPEDFDKKIKPLKYRLEEGGGFATQNGIASNWGGLRLVLADLIMTWLTGSLHQSPNNEYYSQTDAFIPAIEKIKNITKRVAQKEAMPTISMPSHASGWIHPEIWVNRLLELESQNIIFDRIDFVLSLLRLAPDKRKQALKRAANLPEKVRRVVEFALGGDGKLTINDRPDYDIWISAARCRAPQMDWSKEFESLSIMDPWPDSVKPAVYHWKAYVKEHTSEYNYGSSKEVQKWKTPHFDIAANTGNNKKSKTSRGVIGTLKGAINSVLSTDWKKIPSAALAHYQKTEYWWSSDLNAPWIAHWLTYQWPQCPDSAYIVGVRQLVARIDENSSSWQPSFSYFYGLFQKNRPWNEAGHLVLCMGLVGKDADARGLAIDAFIEGVENRCLDIDILARILVQLSTGGWLKLNRLGENLLQISQVSPIHTWVVRELLINWLPDVNQKQNNMFKILEVLLEVQSLIPGPLTKNTHQALLSYKGSSKAAKTAKKILEIYKE